MMFMSIVVHFAEFVMMSLVGIMLYKLYVSYMSWKNACAFSASTGSAILTNQAISYSSEVSDSESLTVMKVNLDLARSKPVVPASQITSDVSGAVKAKQCQISDTKILQPEKKSSTILDDYIGEFFSEPQPLDIDAYRVSTQAIEGASERDVTTSLAENMNENKSDEGYIKVEPFFIVPDSLKQASKVDEVVPTLNEFCDAESDSFITVASMNSEVKTSNKVMSDKVVMAMLDEAKLVRFS
tara:strand:- start:1485 stop:2207 length:723 start_codon:yes stop_codon:yes gene_type:complete